MLLQSKTMDVEDRVGTDFRLPVRYHDGPSLDFSVVEKAICFGSLLQRKMLDQHFNLSRLRQADDLHKLGDRAPVGRGDGAFLCRAVEVYRQRSAADADEQHAQRQLDMARPWTRRIRRT